MKEKLTVIAAAFAIGTAAVFSQHVDYAKTVSTLIGTDYTGNTYPGAQVPFGMVQLSPDNGLPGWDRIAGYFYPDSTIAGFSHTHLSGTGAGDLYDISFLPVTLPERKAEPPLGVHSRFSHSDETAEAGYYQVRLSDYDINVELTATERCGMQRYTFPQNGRERMVILNLEKSMNWDATRDTRIRKVDDYTIEGYRFSDGWARDQRVWFRTRFSQPIKELSCQMQQLESGLATTGRFIFSADGPQQLTVVTAISPTGTDGARRNMDAEAPHNDFDRYRRQAQESWNKELGKIEIEGASSEQRVIFYTALYRSLIAPTLFCDTDGAYRGADKQTHSAIGWRNYETCSLWDTYRAAHPLYTILCPDRTADMVKSFLAFNKESGRLPVWNMWAGETDMMIGYHAVSVISEAALKGIGGFDVKEALEACVSTANLDGYRGIGIYKKEGYVPYDVHEATLNDDWSLSRTLEYAYDDACIARLARLAGDKQTFKVFSRRAKNYQNVYNPQTTFMQPRNAAGTFQPGFSPDEYTPHICESNGWHYMWSVQHDVEGLIKLVGKNRFSAKLDSFFTYVPKPGDSLPLFSTGMIGQYAHGNEPSHHAAYLFNKTGRPQTTRKYVRQILTQLYNATPAGLCGNEDCGQMSAWYVFSAMGFYPLDPTSCQYELGCPLFSKVTIHLPSGKDFVIKATGVADNPEAEWRVRLNGNILPRTWLTHAELTQGGTVEFLR